ncbi:sugar phosphate isomerase/epimerase family protein [Devosia sp.]|uniref:sugar phosphate isomerase/epimerase family protein n=1 Tax=Devosia sp. TaxID=1871048 RepID=UPI002EEC2921
MTGLVRGNVPGFGHDPRADLAATAGLGLSGLMFGSPFEISPGLDRDELAAFKADADALGLALGCGLGSLNVARPERVARIVDAGGGDLRAGLLRLLDAAALLGARTPYFYVGTIEDRLYAGLAWADQLAHVAAVLRELAPALRERGMSLLVKTHEEITSAEIVALIEAVGPDVLGVAFDPVNVVVRGEAPLPAARRLAPHVRQVHLDDCDIRWTGRGVRRVLCPMGEGVVDWPVLLASFAGAACWIDLHRGEFDMPLFEPEWQAHAPGLAVAELGFLAGAAARAETAGRHAGQASPAERLQPMLEWTREKLR